MKHEMQASSDLESNASRPTAIKPTSHQLSATSSAPVPWSPLGGVLYATLVYFAAQFSASIFLVEVLRSLRWSKPRVDDWFANSVAAQFWFVLLAEALTFGAIWWFLRARKAGLRNIGLRRLHWKDIGFALLGFVSYFVVYAVILSVVSNLVPSLNVSQPQDIGFQNATGALSLVLTFISLVILPPLVEEIVFRGFVFGGIRNKLPFVWAALGTSLLFASAHLQIGSGKPLLWVAAIDTFTLSMVLCYLRERTKGLWAGIFVHALKNGIAFVSLFLIHVR
jgi:membrane protease YdiL (CAAX protease family)